MLFPLSTLDRPAIPRCTTLAQARQMAVLHHQWLREVLPGFDLAARRHRGLRDAYVARAQDLMAELARPCRECAGAGGGYADSGPSSPWLACDACCVF